MGTMINRGKELIRISPTKPHLIEVSKNGGISWIPRSAGSAYGNFTDITENGNEILGTTTKGLYVSKNSGVSWIKRS